uniref:Uncharacterized protein n=1 Tax=Pseudomonas phage RVTF4 TaxID=3236931 RepID=A0AB39CCY6_9VIRU
MGTHINTRFQALVKQPDGTMQFEDISSNYDERQHYNLFAWLNDVRNYNGITPIADTWRDCPPDLLHLDSYDRPGHWLLGSEIMDAVDRIHPVTESGMVHTWNKPKFNEEPDGYSRGSNVHDPLTAKDDVIRRDTGYAQRAWEECCNYKRIDHRCSGGKWVWKNGCSTWTGPKNKRAAPEKYRKKMRKYAERVGRFEYRHTWVISPSQRREEFAYFIKEIASLMKEHGEIRMLMNFG